MNSIKKELPHISVLDFVQKQGIADKMIEEVVRESNERFFCIANK